MKIEQIKNMIQSAHLNFLIGSGVSRPYLNTLGGVEIWLTELSNNPSNDEIKDDIVKCSILNEYLTGVIIPNLGNEISKHNTYFLQWVDKELMEDNPQPSEEEKRAIAFDNTIHQYQILLESFHTLLSRRGTNLKNKTINLFTTNIDMLIEYAYKDLGIEFNDGFSGRKPAIFDDSNFSKQATKVGMHLQKTSEIPTINYIKLHGSINWSKGENDKVEADDLLANVISASQSFAEIQSYLLDIKLLQDSYNKKREESKCDSSFVDFLRNKVRAFEADKLQHLKDKLDKAFEAYSKIIMINPTKRKFRETVMDMPFYELMRLYSNALERENSLMFVAGFSFADEHLAKITLRAAANNPTLTVIIFAFNQLAKEDIQKALDKQSRIPNNNIIILTPEEFIASNNDQENPGRIEIKDIKELENFDLRSINKYILKPLIQSIFK